MSTFAGRLTQDRSRLRLMSGESHGRRRRPRCAGQGYKMTRSGRESGRSGDGVARAVHVATGGALAEDEELERLFAEGQRSRLLRQPSGLQAESSLEPPPSEPPGS